VSDYRNEIDFREPITILKQHITQQGLRLIDFFKQLDKDGSGSISRDEFVFGLKVNTYVWIDAFVVIIYCYVLRRRTNHGAHYVFGLQ